MSNRLRRITLWLATSIASSLIVACSPSSGGLGTNEETTQSGPSQPLLSAKGFDTFGPGWRRLDGGTQHDAAARPEGGTTANDGAAPTADASNDGGDEGSAPRPEGGTVYDGGTGGLALHVSGNHLVDATNTPVVLRGADLSGTEFVCAQNYTDDPYGGAPLAAPATFVAMRAWNINAIRLPLNEDCWLDINGVRIGGAAYQAAIEAEVSAAHAAGLFVILDLHWSAPGTQRALSQNPEPDADHSPAFWASVASTFASDPGVLLDLFNEPYDYWGTDPDPWDGWLNGDVQTQYTTGGSPYTITAQWKTAGVQQLLATVRGAGATQPVLVNGLDWANDDSGWLTHAPSDPLGQIVVGAHIYPGESCDTVSCWSAVFPALGARYPVLIGETGDSTAGPETFIPGFLGYADGQGWSYLAWTWNPWGDTANVLVTDWTGTPTTGEGVAWQAHLLATPFQN